MASLHSNDLEQSNTFPWLHNTSNHQIHSNLNEISIAFDKNTSINLISIAIFCTLSILTLIYCTFTTTKTPKTTQIIIDEYDDDDETTHESNEDENDIIVALHNMSLKKASPKDRINSISGPPKGHKDYKTFILTLVIMICSGSANDFLGKLCYQMFPLQHTKNGIDTLKHEYWITYLLTFGAFFICAFAIFTKSARSSYHHLTASLFLKACIPSILDTIVTGGRYLGLVFLSAAVISILKNGLQLLFLAILRRCFHQKVLCWSQVFGIFITMLGLCIVASENIAAAQDEANGINDALIGICIMLIVGFLGAVRNDLEEVLLKSLDLDSNFLVGLESIISVLTLIVFGFVLFLVDPFENINKENALQSVVDNVLIVPGFMICFVLFCLCMYGKDTMQMKMTLLSSSLTRKLFQQVYPSGTWLISLIAYALSCALQSEEEYGEEWKGFYSLIRVGGFVVVLFGNYFYMKGQDVMKKWKNMNWRKFVRLD